MLNNEVGRHVINIHSAYFLYIIQFLNIINTIPHIAKTLYVKINKYKIFVHKKHYLCVNFPKHEYIHVPF